MNLNDLFSVIDTDTLEQITPTVLMANPVILANSLNNEAANDYDKTMVVKTAIQESVRQVNEVSTNGENIKPTTENAVSKMTEIFSSSTHYPKSAVENVSPQIEELNEKNHVTVFSMDSYAHMVKCQQCEHLTLNGYCTIKPQIKPMPNAMRDCVSFDALQTGRISILSTPYTQSELNDLFSRYEKKLFHHLVNCVACSLMDSRYCVDGFAIVSGYDAMLLCFDDAARKREVLLTQVSKLVLAL